MNEHQTKQPVVAVAECLMRTCYDEANRIANHCSDGAARMAMRNLYDAANEAKARLAAAADDSAKAPIADKTAFDCSALLSPLVCWGEGLFGVGLKDGALRKKDDSDGEWEELRAERTGDTWTVTYAPDEVQAWEVYRGRIPSREFFVAIVTNAECGGFGRFLAGNGDNGKLSDAGGEL